MTGISLGMKEARRRLKGDKENPLGMCLNCDKKVTAKEINSCGSKECNAACQITFRWVRGVMKKLSRVDSPSYVNYQMGQGGL